MPFEEDTTGQSGGPYPVPEWLAEKAVAVAKWRELVGELISRGLVSSVDFGLLELYCEAWQQMSDANAEVENEGIYFQTDKGYVGIHPAQLVKDKAAKQIQSLGDRLGIGFRNRKESPPKGGSGGTAKEDDSLEDFSR